MIEEDVCKILKSKPGIIYDGFSLKRLTGDASNRTYYRISNRNQSSYIIMELAEPEAFKASEEKVTSSNALVTELPYINISKFLSLYGIGVPEIYYYDREKGILILEDLGDSSMHEVLKGSATDIQEKYYKKAIDELLMIQISATKGLDHDCIASDRGFDIPLLMWEFDHYIEYGVEARSGIRIPDSERNKIREIFYFISKILAEEPKCLTHRDYHSKNLMIKEERVRVIDFQDALMGPPVYDLASLLRDSYMELDETLIDTLIEYYIERRMETEGVTIEREGFRRIFDLMSVQRNMKAVGRFVYIKEVKKNDNYIQYIPATLNYIKKNLQKYADLNSLQAILSKYVWEIA
ncbi:MAG: phosphotransferase [Nitrospirae bacterium]|nr:phosphotransferase [Nitrospirota bacterium]